MKNAAFPDQIGGCKKSMHYPDDPHLYEFSGLKSKSLKRRSDQRYAHFSIIGINGYPFDARARC